MKIEETRLGFVGFGKMGQTIFRAIDAARLIPRSQILFVRRDSKMAKENEQEFKITSTSLGHLVEASNVLLLCVPSHQAEFVLQDLAKERPRQMILSVMEGIKISFIHKYLDPKIQAARIVPNPNASSHAGISLIAFSSHPTLEFRSVSELIFSALGHTVEIDESQMDAASALCVSGSAFAIELIDAMARLGEKEGIAYSKSLKIAAESFLGAASLILKGLSPIDTYRQALPDSPVAAGLKCLQREEVAKHLQDAILASMKRSQQISEEYF